MTFLIGTAHQSEEVAHCEMPPIHAIHGVTAELVQHFSTGVSCKPSAVCCMSKRYYSWWKVRTASIIIRRVKSFPVRRQNVLGSLAMHSVISIPFNICQKLSHKVYFDANVHSHALDG